MRHRFLHPLLIGALAAGFASAANADEGGVAFWLSGQYASFAAVPMAPGWSLPTEGYYYSGKASDDEPLPRGNITSVGLDSSMPLLMIQPTYSPNKKLWGGQLALGLAFGWGGNQTSADLSISNLVPEIGRSDSITGFADLAPIASLAWNQGNDNWMVYVTGNIPSGDYNPNRLSNMGIGHGAVDAGGAYTYFNAKTGFEFSAVIGVTYNMENNDTNYRNGIDIHLDWSASRFLNAHWQVGLVGYLYGQLTSDSGASPFADGIKSSIASIGPEIGYSFTVNKKPAYVNLRGYWEFAASHRIEGAAAFIMLSIPIGG